MRDFVNFIISKWNSPWRYSTAFAYFFWCSGGLFGLHLFYLKRDLHAFVHLSTGGGCFGIGFLYDFFHIPYYVKFGNKLKFASKDQLDFKDPAKQPKLKLFRILCQSLFGTYVGVLFLALFSKKTYEDYRTPIIHINVIVIALGVYMVANIGKIRCSFLNCLIGPLAVNVLVFLEFIDEPDNIVFHSGFSSSIFAFSTGGWRYAQFSDLQSRNVFVRFIFVYGSAIVLNVLLYNALHIEVKSANDSGQEEAVRVTWTEFIRQSKLIFREMKNLLDSFNANFFQDLRPDTTAQAFKILQLFENATSSEITSQYRKLVKKWHPDRYAGSSDKEKAGKQFMLVRDAYETLMTRHGKRKSDL